MIHKTVNKMESAKQYAKEIFEAKALFHKEQAKLPIEEKIKILIELQKMVIKIQKHSDSNEQKQVWELE